MDSKANNVSQENHETASFHVTKISNWRGKYKRILSVGTRAVTTYNPVTLEVTNQWFFNELPGVKPVDKTEFVLSIIRKKKRDTMRFTCEFRSELLFELLSKMASSTNPKSPTDWRHDAFKHHWSGIKLPVVLEVSSVGVMQLEPTTRQPLATYGFHEIEGLATVADNPSIAIFSIAGFSRLHIFEIPCRDELFSKIHESASSNFGVQIRQLSPFSTLKHALLERFGSYSSDERATSLMEFPVHKISPRHSDAVKRVLCVTDSCLVERDPDTYSICTLKPLNDVFAFVRYPDDQQHFAIEFVRGGVRSYRANDRDALLATLLDGVRSAGNRDVHVKSTLTNRALRLTPLWQPADEEIESMHLRWILQPPVALSYHMAVSRFVCSINYSGLLYTAPQEGIFFSENKEKSIHGALNSLVDGDTALDAQGKSDIELEFLAVRRLVASKAGFAAFTHLPGFREKLGVKVVRALQLNLDHITQAAIDVLCALMEPMYDECDLRQEQLNKSSLLSSPKFLEGILERWTQHVLRGTGALVVISVLDFLTFALCAPYSETTDGGHFDSLLGQIAKRGKELFCLLQHPSLSVVKGAGLLMRAIVEEGDDALTARMQQLALSEAAFPRHLLISFFTRKLNDQGDGRILLNRQLSRKLVALWTTNNEEAEAVLQRILPAGLLGFLESDRKVPENDDCIGEGVPHRDNIKLVVDSEKKQSVIPVAVDRQIKAAQKMLAKHVEVALQHWRSKDHTQRRQERPKERPVVLRRRRQRLKPEGNWDLFYYEFWRDHALPNLIWNAETREELREALENQLRTFSQDRELSGGESIAWNFLEFEVNYSSLKEEVRVGDYYLRVLLQQNPVGGGLGIDIKNPVTFFDELYRRFLTAPRATLRLPCLQAMALVYGRHFDVIGPFPDMAYLVTLLDKTFDYEERDRLVCLLAQLVKEPRNIKGLLDADGLRCLIDLLPLAHFHTRRTVQLGQSNLIEAGRDMPMPEEREKEWYFAQAAGERQGPFSFAEMKELFHKGTLTAKSRCWAQGLDGWKPLQQVSVFKWNLLASGSFLLNESDLAAQILDILIRVCQYFPSRDKEGSIIRPLPRIKRVLSDPLSLPHVVQLLLTFDPILVEKVATLLYHLLNDNPALPRFYNTGAFFFILMYTGSNVLPIARFLKMAHMTQAVGVDEGPTKGPRSVLSPLLPEAMVRYLETYGPDEFSQVFLGEFDTPEVIWGSEMRRLLIEKIAAHLADFSPRLKSNPRALYQYCPIPVIAYPQLEAELFCQAYYLRHLCDTARFPDWPVKEPVGLLRELLAAWKQEVEKKPSGMTAEQAFTTLGIQDASTADEAKIRKAYFKLAQQYHPDKNPEGRVMFEKVSMAYQWLCNRNIRATDGPDSHNILLLLQAQTIVFDRYTTELEPYKYPGYPQLLHTIKLETEDSQLFSKTTSLLAAGTALAYQTVRCSALNAEELRREGGLEALLEAVNRCIPMIGTTSNQEDVPVKVCTNVAKCFAVASRFQACRDRLAEMKMLAPEMCRLLSFRHLPRLCLAASECVSSLAQDSVLQLQLLQAGALWHLLILLFEYDYTLDDGGVQRCEQTNKQEVANTLAKASLHACARMAGYLKGAEASPANTAVQEALSAMLTPYLVGRVGVWSTEEFLKVLSNNTESPILIWNDRTRAELLDYLGQQQRQHIRSGESDPSFGAAYVHECHTSELMVGGIFVRIYNRQNDFPLENPGDFASKLLDHLRTNTAEDVIEPVLQSLYYVIKNYPPVALKCKGHFPTLFRLLRSLGDLKTLALKVISLSCHHDECLCDISTAFVINHLLLFLRSTSGEVYSGLNTLHMLMSNSQIVKETLAKGGVIFALDVFCSESNMDCRVKAAELLARMIADRQTGGKVRVQVMKFLQPLFVDAMRDSPPTAVQLFDSCSENPELIWTEEMRTQLCYVVSNAVRRQTNVILNNTQAEWDGLAPDEESELPNLDREITVAGVYLRLLVSNPGWVLRKPKETLGELLETFLQEIQRDNETERTKMLATAIKSLVQNQPGLLEYIPALGPLPRLLRLLSSTQRQDFATASLLGILRAIVGSRTCVDSLSRLESVAPVFNVIRHHPHHTALVVEVLEKMIACGVGLEEFAQQAVQIDLVGQLLKLLEELTNPHMTSSARALVVSILKGLVQSRLNGARVGALLDQSPCWASYRDQRHDLFLNASGAALPIAGAPNVAGYLTNERSGGLMRHNPLSPPLPPPNDTVPQS